MAPRKALRPTSAAAEREPHRFDHAGRHVESIATSEKSIGQAANGQPFEELRHYCRNPRCRTKLAAPVSNPRDAFCCRGCFDSFYLHRCAVCEGPIEQAKRGRPRLIDRTNLRHWRNADGYRTRQWGMR